MNSVNHCFFMGNLGADPEIRHTNAGRSVANFSIAVTEKFKDRNDDWQENTQWIRVVCWIQPLNDMIGERLRKGDLVYVHGRWETRKWTTQDGQERYATECVVRPYKGSIAFLTPRDKPEGPNDPGQQGPLDPDDDIPF